MPEQSTAFEEAKGKSEYSDTFCYFKYVLSRIPVFLTSRSSEEEISSVCFPDANEG